MDEAERKTTNPPFTRADILPMAGIIVLALVLYNPMFFGRPVMPDTWERFEPWNSELGYDGPLDPRITNANNDAILLYIPWNKFAHDELNKGRIPAWDPYCLNGVPLASNHLVPVFYPIYALIAWLTPPLFILGVSGFVHTIIMAIFFYLFIREWLDNRIAGWLSASFLIVSMLPNPHYQPWPMTLAFYPAIWFLYERWLKYYQTPTNKFVCATHLIWMSLCWAVPLIAGYPSLVFQMSLFTAAWILLRPNMMDGNRPNWKSRLIILIVPFVLGLGLSAVQNIPTAMASMESDRTIFKTSEELSREYAFTFNPDEPWQTYVKRILQPAIPLRFPGNDFLNRGYVGIIPVVFTLLGFGWWKKNDFPKSVVWMALIVGLFALIPLLNFGLYWLTGGVLIDPNPPLEMFGFLVLMLSGVAIHKTLNINLDEKEFNPIGCILGVLLVVIVYIVLGKSINAGKSFEPDILIIYSGIYLPSIFMIIAVMGSFANVFSKWRIPQIVVLSYSYFIIIAFDFGVGYFSPNSYPDHENRPAMPETRAIEVLQELTDENWGRMIRYSENPVNVMSLSNQPYTFYPNLGTYFEIPDAFGYFNLAPKSRFDFLRKIQSEAIIERRGIVAFTPPVDLDDKRLDFIGARYILSDSKIEGRTALWESEKLYIYERPNALPRAFTVDDPSDLSDMKRVEILTDEPGHAVIRVGSEAGRILIFNEGYSRGWSAKVGRGSVPITNFDGLMLLGLGEGESVVDLQYMMPGLNEGWIISGMTVAILLVIAASYQISPRHRRGHTEIKTNR